MPNLVHSFDLKPSSTVVMYHIPFPRTPNSEISLDFNYLLHWSPTQRSRTNPPHNFQVPSLRTRRTRLDTMVEWLQILQELFAKRWTDSKEKPQLCLDQNHVCNEIRIHNSRLFAKEQIPFPHWDAECRMIYTWSWNGGLLSSKRRLSGVREAWWPPNSVKFYQYVAPALSRYSGAPFWTRKNENEAVGNCNY